MIPFNWVIFLAALYIVAGLICSVCEGAWIGPNEATVIQRMMDCQVFTSDSILGKIVGVFNVDLWNALIDMVSFNYAIFTGTWELFRWVILLPPAIAVFYGAVYSLLRLARGGG